MFCFVYYLVLEVNTDLFCVLFISITLSNGLEEIIANWPGFAASSTNSICPENSNLQVLRLLFAIRLSVSKEFVLFLSKARVTNEESCFTN